MRFSIGECFCFDNILGQVIFLNVKGYTFAIEQKPNI